MKKVKQKKILWWVCGIGNGHTYRQLPLIEHFAKTHRIVIFWYDASYKFFSSHYKKHKNISVVAVKIPFYGTLKDWLDFHPKHTSPHYEQINGDAMATAQKLIGKPDLVISDYEPISAQYAYAHRAPLVTIDQQSKYLSSAFPEYIWDYSLLDERMRLRMFFPVAHTRIACSFFTIPQGEKTDEKVVSFPSIIRDEVIKMKTKKTGKKKSVLVYLSINKRLHQSVNTIEDVLAKHEDTMFHLFVPTSYKAPAGRKNVKIYTQWDTIFDTILAQCDGIISTAGHSLLSEAMYLGIPVYAMPLALYEQQMNGLMIASNGYGISAPTLDSKKLGYFLEHLPEFTREIKSKKNLMFHTSGKQQIIAFLEDTFLSQ